jgi:hypothetical protein
MLVEVAGPAPVLDPEIFERGDWRGARVLLEHRRGSDSNVEEYAGSLPSARRDDG